MASLIHKNKEYIQIPKNRARQLTTRLALALALSLGLFFLYPTPVYAMHIAEGILPASWAAAWYAPAVVFIGIGVYMIKRKTNDDKFQSGGMTPTF